MGNEAIKGFGVYDSNFSFENPTVLSAVIFPKEAEVQGDSYLSRPKVHMSKWG